jgi:hypothetical protein
VTVGTFLHEVTALRTLAKALVEHVLEKCDVISILHAHGERLILSASQVFMPRHFAIRAV